jgi:diguanylate cyclase (GGDEF)-like protein
MARYISEEVTIITQSPPPAGKKPQKETGAHLIVLSGTNVGQVFDVQRSELTIGRDERCEVQMLDVGISRRHATITHDESGSFLLEDAGSRNGTFCNNARIEGQYRLRDGDKIQIGATTILKFARADEAEAGFAQQMYEAANRDALTGAFNRGYFDDRIAIDFSSANRHGGPLALLMLDIDHFKAVNDTHGHFVGDQVLKEFAELVEGSIRDMDIFARYGGEEFAVICRHTGPTKAGILGERIRRAVADFKFVAESRTLSVTTSIGIAALPDPDITSARELVVAADEALYQAKQRGRNRVVTRRPDEG